MSTQSGVHPGTSQKQVKRYTSVLVKPTSSRCNLNCTYCFYLSKMELYPWANHPKLTLETYEQFLRQYVPLSAPYLSFMWQGGEPTMMGLPFYQEVVKLQARVAREFYPTNTPRVSNAIQTNGTMIDDKWAEFLKQSQFLVGVSLDGPPEWHNRYRVDWSNRATFDKVMRGIDCLQRYQVPFNVLSVVNHTNVTHPRKLLRWLVDQGFTDLQFIPCVEVTPGFNSASEGGVTEQSVTPDEFGRFLIELFDEWQDIGIDKVRIRWFDNLLQMLWGFPSEMCELARTCGYVLLEHNGDCYPCDFFVEPDYSLGNIHETTLVDMMEGELFGRFSQAKAELHPDCPKCPWLNLCYGECPKYRITNGGQAENSLPYFCSSYKQFFGEMYPKMEAVAVDAGRRLGFAVPLGSISATERAGRRVPNISDVQETARRNNVGRNGVCPCGSDRKYKRCCGAAPLSVRGSQG